MTTWKKAVWPMAIALVMLAMSPAQAGTVRVTDARGDVWEWVASQDPGPHPAPERSTNVDLVGGSVKHTRRSVVLSLRYADLRRERSTQWRQEWLLRTSKRASFMVSPRNASGTGPGAGYTLKRTTGRFSSPRTVCRVRVHRNYRSNRVTFTFPRRCVDSPRWIRAAATTTWCRYCEDVSADRLGSVGSERRWTRKVRVG